MAAPTSRGRFQVELFTLTRDSDKARYETLMQSKFDSDGRIEIIEESACWTKEGDRIVEVKYLELYQSGDQERF